MVKTTKAISPVVATALLLVVAVVAVIGFQAWVETFQSEQQATADESAAAITAIQLNRIDTNNLYIYNSGSSTISNALINITESGTVACDFLQNLSSGLNTISLTANSCSNIGEGDTLEVLIVLSTGPRTFEAFVK